MHYYLLTYPDRHISYIHLDANPGIPTIKKGKDLNKAPTAVPSLASPIPLELIILYAIF